MDRPEVSAIPLLLLIAAGLISPTAALEFNVNIDESVEHGFYNPMFDTETTGLQEINGTVENTGSIGCEYRLRADFNRSGQIDRVWSPPKPLWPGESGFLRLDYLPENYTGTVDTELYLEYCGLEKSITDFSFESTGKNLANGTVDAELERSNSSASRVRLGVEEGYMVPVDNPGGWKLSSARIDDSRATVSYEAPIFEPRTNLTYIVVDSSGEPVGKTRFDLEPEKGAVEMLRENAVEIILVFSILVNLVLASRIPRFRKKLKL